MIVRIKTSVFIYDRLGQQYTIQEGTTGVEKDNMVHFYDVTKSISIAFTLQQCQSAPDTFVCTRSFNDREVSLRDVHSFLTKVFPDGLPDNVLSEFNKL